MGYNVNKGTLALTVYVFYGCVCHGVLPTAALYHLLKSIKMGAGDQRARAVLASTFKILKSNNFFPFSEKEMAALQSCLRKVECCLFMRKYTIQPACHILIDKHTQ